MEKNAFFALAILGLLLCGCESTEYESSHKVKGDEIEIVSEGKIYKISLDYFNTVSEDCVVKDTICLTDEVKTQNTGFTPVECLNIIEVQQFGNYQVRRCIYKTSFEVIICPFSKSARFVYVPFTFEAEEIWLNGKRIFEQPYVFEKTETILSEFENEDEKVAGEYLLDFQITAHNRYHEASLKPFSCKMYVVQLNESGIVVISNFNTTVTYNWEP